MKNDKLTLRNFLELEGNLVYLKKLDKECIEAYSQNTRNCSVETTIYTLTAQVFSHSNIEKFVEEIASDNSRVDFVIYTKESDKMVGEVVLNDIYRNNRSANIRVGINMKEDFNKGYGSEAILLALHYGFGMLNLHRIELEVLVLNDRAAHVYEKIGFKKEGIKRDGAFFNHKYYDLITMSILEDEFRLKYMKDNETIENLLGI